VDNKNDDKGTYTLTLQRSRGLATSYPAYKYNFDLKIVLPPNNWDLEYAVANVKFKNNPSTITSDIDGFGRFWADGNTHHFTSILDENTVGTVTDEKLNSIESLNFRMHFRDSEGNVLDAVAEFTEARTPFNYSTNQVLVGNLTLSDWDTNNGGEDNPGNDGGEDNPNNGGGNNPGNGGGNNPDNGGGNNNPSQENFIPTGFGVRRLGIADYLKVEQSTHAYMPGEVAHIENIMAREYREKSTRRKTISETTETSSSEVEREQLTDTTTASRFEMQTEIAKMMAENTDVSTHVNTRYGGSKSPWQVDMGASFANNRSKEESSRSAVTQAQEVTARALDRVVSKVKEERVRKVVEEFEENNMHGFDNRAGDQHVVGVYRWVDKIMKNQIFNYGKRMMFEFMVPQPAKIHNLAIAPSASELLTKPIDPREVEDWNMNLHNVLGTFKKDDEKDDEIKVQLNGLRYWAGVYNIELDDFLEGTRTSSVSFSDNNLGSTENGQGRWTHSYNKEFEIEEGYELISVKGTINVGEGHYDKGTNPKIIAFLNGEKIILQTTKVNNNTFDNTEYLLFSFESKNLNVSEKFSISAQTYDVKTIGGSLTYTYKLSREYIYRELKKAYNQVISAYEEALAEYEEKVKEANETASNIKETNANFYRQIESDVLKHNCMAYLVDPKVLGTDLILNDKDLNTIQVELGKNLDEYASLVKFMEQAFEWDIMSYNLYPYYWGAKEDWRDLYQSESIDPLFRSFLQSGMARVVVTVKPGFEDAVQFYMSTGKIWSGGEVPVIGDPLYLSIVDEMREPKGEKVGNFWMTRIPTSLNILQAQSIGLVVKHALPFTEENPEDCDNPEMIVTDGDYKEIFKETGAKLGIPTEKAKELITGDWEDSTSID